MSRTITIALLTLSLLSLVVSTALFRAAKRRNIECEVEREVVVVVDTLRYEWIEPIEVVADTLKRASTSAPISTPCDSLYIFRDTIDGRWSAEVAGRGVELRSLEIIDREVHHHTTTKLYTPPVWEVALKARVDPYSQWVGVGVERNIGRLKLSLDGGVDIYNKSPYVGAQASFTIWRD